MRITRRTAAKAMLARGGGSILFTALGHDPVASFHSFFIAPVCDLYGVGELTLKAAPLLLCATGLAIGFRANVKLDA